MLKTSAYAVLAAATTFILSCFTAQAQDSSPCVMGISAIITASNPKGHPFSAVVKVTLDQKLPDGNSIHGTARYHIARDSSGRTLSEMPTGCYVGEDGRKHQMYQVSVYDSAARTMERWAMDGITPGIANISHPPTPTKPSPEEVALMKASSRARQAATQANQWRIEKLGSRTFQNISAEGTRRTRTTPPGEEGNALQLEVINETWFSRELEVTMMSINDDPRRGRSTGEIEELHLGDPDPAMFAPPKDFLVKDQNPVAAPAVANQ